MNSETELQSNGRELLARLCREFEPHGRTIAEARRDLQKEGENFVEVYDLPPAEVERKLEEAVQAHYPTRAVTVRLSDVQAELVAWLWESRIPLGKITVLEGDPGLGKSTLALDLAARLTVGADLPDGGRCARAGVVLLSGEDGPADTIRPRIDAAGGDASRILLLAATRTEKGEVFPSLPADLDAVEDAVRQVRAQFVVVDPFVAYLGEKVNSWKDQEVRRALAQLAALAERTGAAILLIRHLKKGGGEQAIYRGGGSIGIGGAARSVLLVGKDPEDESRRVLAPVKSNLSVPPASLAFRLEGTANGAARVVWEPAPVSITAEAVLAAGAESEEGRGALAEAKGFLREQLAAGSRPSSEVAKAAREAEIADRTLSRARRALGVVRRKNGFEGGWRMSLPGAFEEGRQVSHNGNLGVVGTLGEPLAAFERAKGANSPEDCQECQPANMKEVGAIPAEGDPAELPGTVCAFFVGERLAGECDRCGAPYRRHVERSSALPLPPRLKPLDDGDEP